MPIATGPSVQHILAADDVAVNLKYVVQVLRRHGYAVTTARDGKQAVELFCTQPGRFDGLVFDVDMPVLNGIEAWKAISEIRPGIPVVFWSTDASETARNLTPSARVGFCPKAAAPALLIATLKSVLGDSGE